MILFLRVKISFFVKNITKVVFIIIDNKIPLILQLLYKLKNQQLYIFLKYIIIVVRNQLHNYIVNLNLNHNYMKENLKFQSITQ